MIGASVTVGPVVASWLMDRFGDGSFSAPQGLAWLATGGCATQWITQRPTVALTYQNSPAYVARMLAVAAASAMEIAQESDEETVETA